MQIPEKYSRARLFEALVSIVISQQLGTAVADTIFARVKNACKGRINSESILRTSSAMFRKTGLSGSKTKTLKAIARSVKRKELDLLLLKKLPERDATERLTCIWGIGPWSVEMFMMFALGRRDVFSVGDLGLARAMETIYDLPKDTSRETLLAIAEKWSPYRTYASLLLWATRDSKGQNFTITANNGRSTFLS